MTRRPAVKLASGGHATVWLSTRDNGLVALKRPHPHLVDDPDVRAAIRREAEVALRLRHPSVVRTLGIEIDAEGPVLVLEYVEGATLADLVRDWIDDGRTATAQAVARIVIDAACGLHALHELGDEHGGPLSLVHRDVSPQNVLVGLDGKARISDFGLAKCVATDRATTEGILKGKAGYLAPEYVRCGRGDRRQDVFSLGVVAWEGLTRSRLFRGENDAQTLERVLSMPVPSVADPAPELAAVATKLDPVLRRALARDPDDRFSTVQQFADELERAARDAGVLGTEGDVRASFTAPRRRKLAELRTDLDARGKRRTRSIVAVASVGVATAVAIVLAQGRGVLPGLEAAPSQSARAGAIVSEPVVSEPVVSKPVVSEPIAPAPSPARASPAADAAGPTDASVVTRPETAQSAQPRATRRAGDPLKPRPNPY